MQYDMIAEECSINETQPAAPDGIVNKWNRQILDKLYIDCQLIKYVLQYSGAYEIFRDHI